MEGNIKGDQNIAVYNHAMIRGQQQSSLKESVIDIGVDNQFV